jgi:NAD(P)-dependent dehydrogenase (short-subunit alcohol dehydrogenase family)
VKTEEICASLSKEHSIHCDFVRADLFECEKAASTILEGAKKHFASIHGDSKKFQIDILVNNAGVSQDRELNDLEKGPITPEDFNWHYNINVLAPLLLTQIIAPHLPADGSGRIVNISSVSSSLGFVGQTVYGGTKAALESMTRTWSRELADRATVNAINPGPVIGDMYFATGEKFWNSMQGWMDHTPLSKVKADKSDLKGMGEKNAALVMEKMGGRRPAYTSEIAGIVAMLCLPDAAWCTGSVVNANGGMTFSV